MLLIFCTFPSKKEAENIAQMLIAKKLAKCANIFPCFSIYEWKGKMRNEKEWVLELKASDKNYAKIEKLLLKIHLYELPAIYAVKTEKIEKKFERWVSLKER
jgi:periplasmic divalent cation tolerance protein